MIRWVSHDLGTAPFAEGARCIDVVVVDVRNLLDRAGNDATTIRTHVDAARIALERGQRVLVCCDHGISRSNAIATAVLASARGISFDTALETVFAAAGHPEIRIEMLAEVRAACFPTDTHNTRSARRVLLIGGSGRLGQRLLLSVPAGVEVLAPGRDKLDLLSGPAQIEAFLRRHSIQSVMHFAQPRATNTNRSLGDALAMLRNVLDAAGTRGSPVFFPSNWLVLAGHTDDELLATETTPILPVTCLGEAKSLCEQLIAHYIQRKGLAATVLRSGPVVGAGIAPTFICNLRQLAATGANLCTHRYDNGLPGASAGARVPINVHADEFNELMGDEFIPLINKGGGAGLQVTAYTQTLSDIEARIGNRAKAGQVIGNFNNLFMLRVRETAPPARWWPCCLRR